MPSFPLIPVLAAVVISCTFLYQYIIYPAFLSPLGKIPNAHPTAGMSPAWILFKRYTNTENKAIHAAHEKFGPIVRLGPNEVSVNSYDGGLRAIYAGGFPKHEFYARLFMNYGRVPNMFSTSHSKPHSLRKRMLSNVYSKSYLLSSPTMAALSSALIHTRLLPKIQRLAATAPRAGEVEVYDLFNQATMDFITAYLFGLRNASNFIGDDALATWWYNLFHNRRHYMFWRQELPQIPALLSKFGITMIPEWVSDCNVKLDEYTLKLCDAAAESTAAHEESHPEDIPVVFRQLKTALESDAGKASQAQMGEEEVPQRLLVASEMHDQLVAGQETSSITLTYLFWELSRNQALQDDLRAELLTLSPPIRLSPSATPSTTVSSATYSDLPPAKDIDALPLLNAILLETLRLHAAIPGPEPRMTPPSGAVLGPVGHAYAVPGNVRVSSQPYTLHRIASVFPDAERFMPERWFPAEGVSQEEREKDEERLREMGRHFWAFSSGGRMCIGSHFANQEMKLVIAALISTYKVFAVEGGDVGIEQKDAYVAQPASGRLVLRFEEV